MKNLKDKIAVITGAASGIGRELAVGLAREGCGLALADVDLEGLKETEKLVASAGGRAIIARVDVSSRDEMYAFAGRVVSEYGAVDIVINNAGIVYTSVIEDISYGDFERVMNINFWGTVYGTRAFLEHLKKRESAHLVNISSVYGLWALATQGSYSASKFAVRGFTETLMQEMRGTGVTVSCVYPGGVRTNIILHSGSRTFDEDPAEKERFMKRFNTTAFTTAEKAARVIITGIRRNRKRIRIGPDAFLFDVSQRMFPTLYQKLGPMVMRMMGLES
jgi:NAD(P)-dependent dehydrogenase (short-subunit alcohol dehydrogenase family)